MLRWTIRTGLLAALTLAAALALGSAAGATGAGGAAETSVLRCPNHEQCPPAPGG